MDWSSVVLSRLAHRVGHDLGPVAQVELGEDVTHVVRRGLAADVQSLGNLGVGKAGGQEPEHLLLAIGQLPDTLGAGASGHAQRAEEGGDAIGVEGGAKFLETGERAAEVVNRRVARGVDQCPAEVVLGVSQLERQLEA